MVPYEITLLSVCPSLLNNFFACVFVAAGKCLLSCSKSRLFWLHYSGFHVYITLHSKVVGHGVFYAVCVISSTQHVVKGK
jgi:hypothetical protein